MGARPGRSESGNIPLGLRRDERADPAHVPLQTSLTSTEDLPGPTSDCPREAGRVLVAGTLEATFPTPDTHKCTPAHTGVTPRCGWKVRS